MATMNNSDYTVETIESLEGLKEIKNDWERLFNLENKISSFFSFEVFKIYYETIIKNFDNVKIKIFVVRNENQKIIAIFPFTLESKIYPPFLPLKELSIKDGYLIGFYNFLTDPQENQEIIFQRFLEYLKKIKRRWDVIKLYSISADDKLLKVFTLIFGKFYKTEESESDTLVVDCDIEFDEYIKSNMKGKYRREMKRKIRRFEESGNLKLIEMRKKQEIEKGLTYFYDIEDSGWKGKEGTSLKRSYYGEYYKDLAYHFSKENKFRLYFLQLNNEYIAGVYAIIDRETLFLIKIGYSDDFSRYSPSSILFYLMFEQLFMDKKIRKIDFYGPYHQYQKIFGKQTRKDYDITICNKKVFPYVYFVFLKVLNVLMYLFPGKLLEERRFVRLIKRFNIGSKKMM